MSAHRDKLGQAFVNRDNDYNAYSPQKGAWYLCHNGYTFAKIQVETVCEKHTDYSGMKKYRLVRRQKMSVSVRVYTSRWYTIKEEMLFHNGEVAAIKEILEWCADEDWAYKQARFDVDVQFKNVSDTARSAIWFNCFDDNEQYVYRMMKAQGIL